MRYLLALVLTFAFGTLTGGSSAQAASKAAPIIGTWVGNGVVTSKKSGRKETVRCRISYRKSGGKSFGVSATCASTAGRTKTGRGRVVKSRGNRYSGRMYDKDHTVSGTITVTVRGNRQTLTVSSSRGSGRLTLRKR